MKKPKLKATVRLANSEIPVYFDTPSKKVLGLLTEALETKLKSGKKTVQRFLKTLDSIEIEGCEAILYSKKDMDTLALSLY